MYSETEKNPSLFKRLREKPVSFISLLFIFFAALISVFAYLWIDDRTPDANEQNPEIALVSPGFKTPILYLKRNASIEKKSFLSAVFSGKENAYYFQPYKEISYNEHEVEIRTHFDQLKYIPYNEILSDEEMNTNDKGAHVRDAYIHHKTYILGTDKYGRSILSRLVLGIRVSLGVGLLAVLISLTVGIFLGSIAAYFGGWVDQLVMFIINVTWSIPTLLLVFAIVLAFGRGIGIIFLAVGLTMWVDVARIVRGQVKKVKEEQFVMAARSLGYDTPKIIIQHILPNIIGPVLVIAAANFATAILLEAGLSYLGFGIKPPSPSIGNMLNENYGYALSSKPFLAIIPAVTIMLLVLSFNLVGSGLRDIFDVKQNNV